MHACMSRAPDRSRVQSLKLKNERTGKTIYLPSLECDNQHATNDDNNKAGAAMTIQPRLLKAHFGDGDSIK